MKKRFIIETNEPQYQMAFLMFKNLYPIPRDLVFQGQRVECKVIQDQSQESSAEFADQN